GVGQNEMSVRRAQTKPYLCSRDSIRAPFQIREAGTFPSGPCRPLTLGRCYCEPLGAAARRLMLASSGASRAISLKSLNYFVIITSVALITAETESPLLRTSSSALSRVIIDSMVPASTDILI